MSPPAWAGIRRTETRSEHRPDMKRTPLRPRSKKREKLMQELRAPLVARLLEERPWCERGLKRSFEVARPFTINRSTVIHEKRLRSAGGSITDEEANTMFALCQDCHQEVHAHPAQSRKDGWLEGRVSGT